MNQKLVLVKTSDFKARARRADYDHAQAQLILSGAPVLSRGQSTLTGKRVLIWLEDERVVIEKATGKIDPMLLKTLRDTSK